MYKKLIVIVLLIFLVSLYIVQKEVWTTMKIKTFTDLQDREKVRISISSDQESEQKNALLQVEIVNTPESTAQGLSGRTEIGTDGMFFVFPQKQVHYFWMKDMQFDIDIVWIANNKVVGITSAVPKPAAFTLDNHLETYPSPQEVDMVLEMKSNDSEKFGINPGDVVQLVK